MKAIIAGGRNYVLSDADRRWLAHVHLAHGITEVVSGGAMGVDAAGEVFAVANNIPVRRFPADWKAHGKAAGPIRNRQMAQYADALIAFPGGRGTANMIQEAKKQGLKIYQP